MAKLSKTAISILKEYGDSAKDAVNASVMEVTKESAKKLKKSSPKRSGYYAKHWRGKTEKGRLVTKGTVYNAENYNITHLLENGHAKRGGGRVAPKEHIAPVNEWAQEELVKKVVQKLS